jgi:hypothetical protein
MANTDISGLTPPQPYLTEGMSYVERAIHETRRSNADLKAVAKAMTPVPELKRASVTTPFPAQALGAHAQDTGLKTKGW